MAERSGGTASIKLPETSFKEPAEKVPAFWDITEVNGQFRAVNSVTGRVYEGKPQGFTRLLNAS
jgi:hypothetical protein